MIRLIVNFFVPPRTDSCEILEQAENIYRSIIDLFSTVLDKYEVPTTLYIEGNIKGDSDAMVSYGFAVYPLDNAYKARQALIEISKNHIKQGIVIYVQEFCPQCKKNCLQKLNSQHEYCKACGVIFETRDACTDDETSNSSQYE